MKRVITINSNDLEKSLYTKELLTKKLEENNFLVSSKLEENTELIISIGGDGSFLKTIQDFKFPSVPMVVINTGHLGFFAEFDPDEIDEFIELYKNNDFIILIFKTIAQMSNFAMKKKWNFVENVDNICKKILYSKYKLYNLRNKKYLFKIILSKLHFFN